MSDGERRRGTAPDDGLLNGVVKGHEELRVLPDAAHKVPDKHVEAVRRGRLNASRDAAVVRLDVGLQAKAAEEDSEREARVRHGERTNGEPGKC